MEAEKRFVSSELSDSCPLRPDPNPAYHLTEYKWWVPWSKSVGFNKRSPIKGITDGLVALSTSLEHPGQHRHMEIGVVIYHDFLLHLMQSVESPRVLGQHPAP
jgi:hypothetical protein